MNKTTRFARIAADGRIVALVADGPVPEWPTDLAAVEDAQLRVLEEAYLAEFARLEADPNADLGALRTLAEHVASLRAAAAERLSSTEPEVAPEADPAPEAEPEPEPEPTPEPAPEAAADRAAALAGIRDLMNPPAPPAPTVIQQVGMDAEAVTAAMTAAAEAGARAAALALTPVIERMNDRPANPEPASAAGLGLFRPTRLAPIDGDNEPRRRRQLIASADVPGLAMGAPIPDQETLVKAFIRRHETLGVSTGVNDEKIPVASLSAERDPDRDLTGLDWQDARRKVMKLVGPEAEGVDPWTGKPALIASGGISAPVEPFYEQPVFATGARPVLAALPTFTADRGGIRLVPTPSIGSVTGIATPGLFTDGVTNTDTSFVSATAAFTSGDLGQPIVGSGIPAGTIIATVTNGTTVVLSAATTATATGVTFHLPSRNPNNLGAPVGLVSAAQDAVGFGTIKYTFDVPIGSQREFDVYAVYTSLQFANLTARTFPEQVEAYIRVTDALSARVAETALLDQITNWSEKLTGAKTFGTARQLLAQIEHNAAYYRSIERMDPQAVLRVGIPAWAINAMRGDYISSFIGGASEWGLSDDELEGWFRDRRLMPFFYLDGPTDVSQLFTASSGATNTGANTATAVAIPDYPGSGATTSFRTKVVTFLWAEGTWLGLTTGELNLGLIRDSITTAQNRFRQFAELWEAPAFIGTRSIRCVHTVASDGSYAAAASVTLGVGSGL